MEKDEDVVRLLQTMLDNQTIPKEEILLQLESKLSELLTGHPEGFFQLMYRLDIPETKVTEALKDNEQAIGIVALLIYDRQVEKRKWRNRSNQASRPTDADLEW